MDTTTTFPLTARDARITARAEEHRSARWLDPRDEADDLSALYALALAVPA